MPATRRQLGTVEHITAGVEAYARDYDHRIDGHRGGIVVNVTETPSDDEPVRAFTCIPPHRTRPYIPFDLIAEPDVDLTLLRVPDTGTVKTLWKRLAEEIAFIDMKCNRQRRGKPTRYEVKCAFAFAVLTDLLVPTPIARDTTLHVVDTTALANLGRSSAEVVARSRGPVTLKLAQHAHLPAELARLTHGPGALHEHEMDAPEPQEPVEPRPWYPANVSALVD